jgi:hypothetical protein
VEKETKNVKFFRPTFDLGSIVDRNEWRELVGLYKNNYAGRAFQSLWLEL